MTNVTKSHWRTGLWLVMLALVLFVAWEARQALFPFALGAVLAYAFSPLVDKIAALIPAKTHRGDVWRRGAVVFGIYLFGTAMLIGAGIALIPLAVEQADQFIEDLPVIVEGARAQLLVWFEEYQRRVPLDMQARLETFAEGAGEQAALVLANAARGAFGALTGTIGMVFGFLIVPFFMFYAMRDRHFVSNNIVNAVPDSFRQDAINIGRMSDHLLGRYIRAQLLLALIVGVSIGVGLTLMDVRMSLALAVWAGLTELIPIIGPWLGAIPALIIVAATQPDQFIWVALLFLGVQAAENYLLVPRLQSHAVDIHPAMVVLLLAIAGSTFGILGMLVVIPLVAIIRELFWYVDSRLKGETADEAFAHSKVGQRPRDRALDARVDEVPEDQQLPAEDPFAMESAERPDAEEEPRPV